MIADLHKIQRHTLTFDALSIVAIGRGLADRFNRLVKTYEALSLITLPQEKKIITPAEFDLK